jgi:hypothetical protein
MKLINEFAELHPTTSIRQVTLKLGEITQKEPPACVDMTGKKVRAFMFYLRPKFYKYLPPDERPPGWEKYAEEDEIKWQQEKEEEREQKEAAKAKRRRTGDSESVTSDLAESASNVSPSVGEGEEDGDETEDEDDDSEPVAKKLKVED